MLTYHFRRFDDHAIGSRWGNIQLVCAQSLVVTLGYLIVGPVGC
jgi:hypothetical protein